MAVAKTGKHAGRGRASGSRSTTRCDEEHALARRRDVPARRTGAASSAAAARASSPSRRPSSCTGCCSYGAHFSDTKDRDHVEKAAKLLDDDEWQFGKQAEKKGIYAKVGKDDDGTTEWRTRLVDDACIFLNRPGFAAGPGCALHQHAARTGQHHSDVKPEVCWQLPLRHIDDEEDDGTVDLDASPSSAAHGWGEGGEDFAWWCTEAPEAFVGARPGLPVDGRELRKMLGDKLYRQVVEYLDEREHAAPPPVVHHVGGAGALRRAPAARRSA